MSGYITEIHCCVSYIIEIHLCVEVKAFHQLVKLALSLSVAVCIPRWVLIRLMVHQIDTPSRGLARQRTRPILQTFYSTAHQNSYCVFVGFARYTSHCSKFITSFRTLWKFCHRVVILLCLSALREMSICRD